MNVFNLLKSILQSDAGSFGFVVGILILAFWLVHWITKKVTSILGDHSIIVKSLTKQEQHIDDIRKDITCLKGNISSLQNQIQNQDSSINEIKKDVTYLKGNIGNLQSQIQNQDSSIGEIRKDMFYLKGNIDVIRSGAVSLTQSHSPISLTERGLQVAQEIKAEFIINENWTTIFNLLEENVANKNAYDIQEYAIDTASVEPELFFNEKSLLKLKEFAFKEGNNIQYYLGMFGVLIRDRYLKEKNINIEEVDKHDPNKTI